MSCGGVVSETKYIQRKEKGHRQTQIRTQEELILDQNPEVHCPRLLELVKTEGKV